MVGGPDLRVQAWVVSSPLSIDNISRVKIIRNCGNTSHSKDKPVDPVPLLLHVAGLGHLPIDLHGEEDGLLCSGGK